MTTDAWSDWLVNRRSGGSATYDQQVRARTAYFAKRVIDNAGLAPGMTLADLGTGEGLVAFHAIDRVGASLRVILSDISDSVLRLAETAATDRGVRGQCTFLQCSAERLAGIADASVDIVTMRSVLAYVANKPAALREILRILKPGGRLSMAEPIFLDDALEVVNLRNRMLAAPQDPLLPLLHRWKSSQFPDTLEGIAKNTLTQNSERDLVRLMQAAGFTAIHLELHIDILPNTAPSWDVFVDIAPYPMAPTLREIIDRQFTPDERKRLEDALRPTSDGGQIPSTERMAYIVASKP